MKFSIRVNHETRSPDLELALGRSAAAGISQSFHPNRVRSVPNELEFGWEQQCLLPPSGTNLGNAVRRIALPAGERFAWPSQVRVPDCSS